MTATVRALHSARATSEIEAQAATVRLLRQRRGLTLADLAANVQKQPAWASRIETGKLTLRGRDLVDCAAVLNVPPEMLATPVSEADLEGVHFRKYRVPKKVEARATAEGNFVAYLVNSLLVKAGQEQDHRFPQIDANTLSTDPREAGSAAARIVRDHWGLGTAPINDLAGRIESGGLFIAPLPPDITKVSAVSVWHGAGNAPVTLLDRRIIDDTRRFTLAHELGHIVMDQRSGLGDDKDIEARADAFAGELLAPYDQVRDTVRSLDLSMFGTLMQLQRTWGLHPSSFIRRGYFAGDITASAQTRWFQEFNGARRNLLRNLRSPYPLQPTAIGALLTMMKSVGWTAATLARDLHVHVDELAAVLDGWPFTIGITPVQQQPALIPVLQG
ncbi:helix-turn-helix domain-containing protein [Dermacoccaceae bacterium W4C1]